jgi:hypothetical protein
MNLRLYLETTIPSYLTAWPSRDIIVAGHQQVTREWWRDRRHAFEIYVSQFVIDEAAAGDVTAARDRLEALKLLPLLEVTNNALDLASDLVQSGVVPQKAARDAAHIAISAVHRMDYLMTWNCTHIANAAIKKSIQSICERHGQTCPIICTPEQLLEDIYVP